MKKIALFMVVGCLLFVGCGSENPPEINETPSSTQSETAGEVESETTGENQDVVSVKPLLEMTMEEMSDAVIAVSLEKGDVYVDDAGVVQMDVKVYAYDRYDMVDIANLKAGDTLVTHAGPVEIASVDRDGSGTVYINGGLDGDGFNLVTDDTGILYEVGLGSTNNWYEVGAVTLPVATNFQGTDSDDRDLGEVTLTADSFLNDEIVHFNFNPNNTTIRVEAGQVVELVRIYRP